MAAGRGKVKTVIVDREVIQRGAREDLRGAWECTDRWAVDWYAFVNREDGPARRAGGRLRNGAMRVKVRMI